MSTNPVIVREEISLIEFYGRCLEQRPVSGILTIETIKIKERVQLTGAICRYSNQHTVIKFKNCEFSELYLFRLHHTTVVLENCEISHLHLDVQDYSINLTVLNCNVNQIEISTLDSTPNGSIHVKESKVNKVFILSSIDTIALEKSHILEIDINGIDSKSNVNINRLVCDRLESNQNIKVNTVLIGFCLFQNFNGSFIELTKINISTINLHQINNANLILSNSPNQLTLAIETCTNTGITVSNSKLRLLLETPTSLSQLKVQMGGELIVKHPIIGQTYCKVLEFKNYELKHDQYLSDFVIESMILDSFKNHKLLQLNNFNIQESLTIKNSILGDTTFNNLTIPQEKVLIIDSNIEKTIFTNFNWGNYKLDEVWSENKHTTLNHFLISLRESYRQLKNNYIKNGNRIESLEFQKHEMRIHLEILKGKKYQNLQAFGNYLIVGSNKLFSDFGQNIWKPLLCLLIGHIVCTSAVVITNPEIGFQFAWEFDLKAICKSFNFYFQTILPTHSSTIDNVSIGGFWDFLMRVSSGYFIFYFISATRKYHQS